MFPGIRAGNRLVATRAFASTLDDSGRFQVRQRAAPRSWDSIQRMVRRTLSESCGRSSSRPTGRAWPAAHVRRESVVQQAQSGRCLLSGVGRVDFGEPFDTQVEAAFAIPARLVEAGDEGSVGFDPRIDQATQRRGRGSAPGLLPSAPPCRRSAGRPRAGRSGRERRLPWWSSRAPTGAPVCGGSWPRMLLRAAVTAASS